MKNNESTSWSPMNGVGFHDVQVNVQIHPLFDSKYTTPRCNFFGSKNHDRKKERNKNTCCTVDVKVDSLGVALPFSRTRSLSSSSSIVFVLFCFYFYLKIHISLTLLIMYVCAEALSSCHSRRYNVTQSGLLS